MQRYVRVYWIDPQRERIKFPQHIDERTGETAIKGHFLVPARGDDPGPAGIGRSEFQPRPDGGLAAMADIQYEQRVRTLMVLDPAEPCLDMLVAEAAVIAVDVKMPAVLYAAVAQDVDNDRARAFPPTLPDHFPNGIVEDTAGGGQFLGLCLAGVCRIAELLENGPQLFGVPGA